MNFKFRLVVGLIFIASLMTGCASCSRLNGGKPATVNVRLLWLNQAQFAGLYVAKEKGIYQGKGLNVTIVPGGPGVNPVRMVASGSEQIGIASGPDIILARDKGIPVKALAVIVPVNPTCFFSKADSGISAVKDFAGKKIGVKVGFELEYYLTAMLKNAGVSESQITRVPIQFDMTPFFRGDVDVWCGYRINEPNIARAQGIEVKEILPADYGVNVVGDVIFTSEAFYKEHPDVCWSFVEATSEGWQAAKANPGEAVNFTMKYNEKGDPKQETAMLNSMLPLVFTPGRGGITDQHPDIWRSMILLLKENKIITTDVQPADCYWAK